MMFAMALLLLSPIETPVEVDAQTVLFDGNELQLSGGVAIEYKGTRITCSNIELDQVGGHPSVARFSGDVELGLGNGGHLLCERADLDIQSGECLMTGSAGVVFSKLEKDGTPMLLQSRRMKVQLAPEGKDLKSRVEQVVADRNVLIEWGEEHSAHADQLTYRIGGAGSALISLQPRGVGGMCEVRSAQGEVIRASQIYIDQGSQRILFDSPVGQLFMASENKPIPIDFSAGALSWDQQGHVLTLSDDVKMDQGGFGTITSTDTIKFWQNAEIDTPHHIEGITSQGKTVLAYRDQSSDLHYLVCYGEASVDPISQVILFQAGRDMYGNIDEQVFFHDEMGELFADSVELEYREIEGQQQPHLLTVDGSVKIMNRAQWGSGDEGRVLQYALADKLLYEPDSEVMRLLAVEEERVLFYDRVNRVQISAPAVNIRRDKHSGKPSYEGVGDVRFTFVDQELAQLRQNFAQELEEKF